MRSALLAAALAISGVAATVEKAAEPDEKTRLQIVEYMIKTDTNQADLRIAKAFLALDPATIPKKFRERARAKRIEIETLLKLHDTKKKGRLVQPAPGCVAASGVHPTKDIAAYTAFGAYDEIQEDERDELEKKTRCTEDDMVCQFSLIIFYDKGSKKPRRLFLSVNDPLMGPLAGIRNKDKGAGGQTPFFGTLPYTCMH